MNEEIFESVFKTWTQPLLKFLNSDYFTKLTKFISKSYDNKYVFPTNKRNVFKAFQLTDYNDLKVVIIGKEPNLDGSGTGLAFANSQNIIGGIKLSPYLTKISKCVENTVYKGFNLSFDPTLESWAEQGVLLLNPSLTVERGKPGSHYKYWYKFNEEVLRIINDNTSGIIFMLWGEEAQKYEESLSLSKHYVLKCEHPNEAVKEDRDWECDHFVKANEIIKRNNGSEFCIEW